MAQGFTNQLIEESTQALDYNMSGDILYVGEADAGSLKSAASWAIKKIIYDGNAQIVDIVWANGSTDKINIWDDRASLTYS